MSNYASLKATINANVRTNGNQEITGAVMNSVLRQMVDILGIGYQFMGVAQLTTNPSTPDQKALYVAIEPGIYTYFNNTEIPRGCVGFFTYDSAWTYDVRNIVDVLVEGGYSPDLTIMDENGNAILALENGHIKTKNFDSSRTATDSENGMMSAVDKAKLDGIEAGADKSDVSVDNDTPGDFSIKDQNNNFIAIFENGGIKTKKFDSSKVVTTEDDSDDDYSVEDEADNKIISIKDGYPMTKHFNGKEIKESIASLNTGIQEINGRIIPLESWSRMPGMSDNPLAQVRFDGGMGRIFLNWGFIGDSLNSGEMYGHKSEILSLEVEHDGSAISNGEIISQAGSVVTEEYPVSAYSPSLRLVFPANTGLNGKVLVASVSGGVYTPLITGGTETTYTTILTSGNTIVVSYPSANAPQILFDVTYVNDMYEYSWGQQMARLLGASGYNFSVGGEYCKRWCTGANNNRRWGKAQTDLKDVYTLALGVNDRGYWLKNRTDVVDYPCVTAYPNQSQYGSLTITKAQVLADIDLDDYNNNANSYAGWYAGIIQRIQSVRKHAHIFCITNPGEGGGKEWNQVIRLVVEIMREKYGTYIWLVDLATYNPITPEMSQNCSLNGHLSAFGYLYSAYQISTYIDWLIRNNIDAFRGSSLIGTGATVNPWEL